MKWKSNFKRGELFTSEKGYKVIKQPNEPCYCAFDPQGNQLPELFYYHQDAKVACREHESNEERIR